MMKFNHKVHKVVHRGQQRTDLSILFFLEQKILQKIDLCIFDRPEYFYDSDISYKKLSYLKRFQNTDLIDNID